MTVSGLRTPARPCAATCGRKTDGTATSSTQSGRLDGLKNSSGELEPDRSISKVVRSGSAFNPYEDVAAKVVRSGGAFDMDLIDPGSYDSKLVRSTSADLEGLQEDNII